MKKKLIMITLVLTMMLSLPLTLNEVFAGNLNQNDDLAFAGKSVERGTGKANGLDGCAPPTQSGNLWVYVPSDLLDAILLSLPFPLPEPLSYYHEWEGGPCCPSNTLSELGNEYPLPNQCCNGPDYFPAPPIESGEASPGNHCVCFEIRGYPFSILPF